MPLVGSVAVYMTGLVQLASTCAQAAALEIEGRGCSDDGGTGLGVVEEAAGEFPRRGEAAGPRWVDVDLVDARALTINQQRLAYGRTVAVGPPKTVASRRTIALDRVTVTVLRAHRRRQEKERAAAGQAWQDTGYVFTSTDGQPGSLCTRTT